MQLPMHQSNQCPQVCLCRIPLYQGLVVLLPNHHIRMVGDPLHIPYRHPVHFRIMSFTLSIMISDTDQSRTLQHFLLPKLFKTNVLLAHSTTMTSRRTVGQNQVVLRNLIIHIPTSSGVSAAERVCKVSSVEQTNVNERTDERVAQYFILYSWLIWPTVPS